MEPTGKKKRGRPRKLKPEVPIRILPDQFDSKANFDSNEFVTPQSVAMPVSILLGTEIEEQKREEQLAQIEAKKNEVVQIAPVKIKTQAELDADYLYELRRDYGGAFANANKTLEEMLEIKRKKEEERNRPVKWFDQAKIEQAPTLDASLRDLYGNLLHNY